MIIEEIGIHRAAPRFSLSPIPGRGGSVCADGEVNRVWC
jgi:hypothetical protein